MDNKLSDDTTTNLVMEGLKEVLDSYHTSYHDISYSMVETAKSPGAKERFIQINIRVPTR